MSFSEKTAADALKELKTGADGLSAAEAAKRLSVCGPNELSGAKRESFAKRLLSQLMDPLIYVLFFAGAVSVALGESGDACIIAAVVGLNAAVGMIQEGKAWRALDALKKMTRLKAVVRRDGRLKTIDAAELVPGDLVILDAGRQVPADLRLLHTENLRIEESALTGESKPVKKDAAFVAREALSAGDCKNLAYMSTNVTAGRGEGVVVAAGMETEIGKIAKLIREAPREITPLQKRLGELGRLLSLVAVILCVLLFAAAVLQKRDAGEMLITAISLAVAAVPEGLPAIVTIVLALSVSRMAKVNTIVRRLPSVETLGAVSVVCSDKTGTLTENRMRVEGMWTAGALLSGAVRVEASRHGSPGAGGAETSGKAARSGSAGGAAAFGASSGQEELLRAFALCNDAWIGGGQRIGDPTELALLEYAGAFLGEKTRERSPGRPGKQSGGQEHSRTVHLEQLRRQFPRTAEREFDSERKRMTTVHRGADGLVSFTKGAPDVILSLCDRYRTDNGERAMGESGRRRFSSQVERLSAEGFRVLGAAVSLGDNRAETGLLFLGLCAMSDPPRPEAYGAVKLFQKAHVRTVMITGDHKKTAFAVAKRLGIAESEAQCMSGAEIDQTGDEGLLAAVERARVFARVSPDHKVRIVRAFRRAGHIVAMTGDGVNDAPSLKAADVGIAMGQSGTDVAKQAADLILTDDNFATIERAIEEGRGIYENIRKSVIFLLSSNFGEIMTMFAAILCAFPSPLKASHILWINLITDSLPALALGTDRNDGRALMREKPRAASESLFARGGLACTVFYGVLIAVISLTAFLKLPVCLLAASGLPVTPANIGAVFAEKSVLAHSQTYAFTVLGLSQLFHAVGMRDVERSVFRMNHLENRLMLFAVAAGFALQAAVTEIPFLVQTFQTVRLSAGEWGELLFLAAAPMAAHEMLVGLSALGAAGRKRFQ